MSDLEAQIPFQLDDWVIDQHNAGQRGQYTGRSRKAGSHVMVELRYPDGSPKWRPLSALQAVPKEGGVSIRDRLKSGPFGKVRDLQRLITYEKLKGTLHEVVYSMEAAQIDFYPYQFKPVLKFINSPTERLIIADEVGLGKTIESALVWTELQARRQAQRMLVVCPKILTDKWRDELRNKFLLDARIVDFRDLQQELAELKSVGPAHPFILIASYSGLRPPKKDLKLLDKPPEDDEEGGPKARFLREIRHWSYAYPPFDLVVFDEAHYMRNAGTSTFHLGESLSGHNDTGVLCVSATPVNNSNTDLHSLLRLIDRDFFETQGMFDELLEANRPAIQALNALSRTPLNLETLTEAVEGMAESEFINNSPLFEQFLKLLEGLEAKPGDKPLIAKAQDVAEKLNLLGAYVNRTRRVQVEEGRPRRRANVLSVKYTDEEMTLYNMILKLVRKKCRREKEAFHVFRVLGLQLRAASCLPAIANDIREGRLKGLGGLDDLADLLAESFGEEVFEDFWGEDEVDEDFSSTDFKALMDYDFEKNDSKFKRLKDLLVKTKDLNEKVVIFAYYRGTISYLRRRLIQMGINVAVIHGGVDHEARWEELDRFRDPLGPRVLISSEVGSEGIDLQFCRRVVNYDLPWNPMRVEQRIGRIDRVGQKAKVLSIVNFKVKDTVEERLYDRLHKKLLRFANSLGDLEAVIGEEVQKLTMALLSQELTPEEELARMDDAERAVENQLLAIQKLEESGDSLVALSDYVQKKIRENRDKGRYIQAEELEDYVSDFFEREFPGTEINYNTPYEGCIRVRLTPEGQASLATFVRNDRSLSARSLRQREFAISFRREALERLPSSQRRTVQFVNHLSPLIRWITQRNRDGVHSFYNVSAVIVPSGDLDPGDYCFKVERWTFRGLSSRESMAAVVMPLEGAALLDADRSERVLQQLLRDGKDWDYVSCDREQLASRYIELGDELMDRFESALETYEAENATTVQIRIQRAANHWDRLIQQSEKAVQTMKIAGRKESMIRGRETRLKNERDNKEQRLRELQGGEHVDIETEEVAAGIFRVVRADQKQSKA
jgi:superfamily II DNA or RNA helicase